MKGSKSKRHHHSGLYTGEDGEASGARLLRQLRFERCVMNDSLVIHQTESSSERYIRAREQ
jgi:hypothetical protein